MAMTLSPEIEKLIAYRMKELGIDDSELFLAAAVQNYEPQVYDYDDLDAETKEAIEQGQSEIDRGLGIPWEDVRKELFEKFVKKD
jgi:predicted transcriptional regulator